MGIEGCEPLKARPRGKPRPRGSPAPGAAASAAESPDWARLSVQRADSRLSSRVFRLLNGCFVALALETLSRGFTGLCRFHDCHSSLRGGVGAGGGRWCHALTGEAALRHLSLHLGPTAHLGPVVMSFTS